MIELGYKPGHKVFSVGQKVTTHGLPQVGEIVGTMPNARYRVKFGSTVIFVDNHNINAAK